MMDQKETYHYGNYVPNLDGARLLVVAGLEYLSAYNSRHRKPYDIASWFMKTAQNPPEGPQNDDFLRQKVDLTEDKVGLILGEIDTRESLTSRNLEELYNDLLRVSNWRLERPFPENELRDKIWMDFNKLELQVRDQIRREKKDSAKDIAFPNKDLRHSLLEFKIQNQKVNMLDMGNLEAGVMGLDNPYEAQTGDPHQSNYY